MRIGEIAAVVGLTTRAIRHYHHVGLLPEPERRPNGYRAYSLRDAVLLARVRRLTELGLSLDEVRDVLADDAGRELADVLTELDADLARQEAEIRERRRRLAVLLAAGPGEAEPLSPALAALLAKAPLTDSPAAAKDREHLILLDATAPAARRSTPRSARSPPIPPCSRCTYASTSSPTRPSTTRGSALAAELVAAVPDEVFAAVPADGTVVAGFKEALLAEYAPAQAEVVRLVMEAFIERGRG